MEWLCPLAIVLLVIGWIIAFSLDGAEGKKRRMRDAEKDVSRREADVSKREQEITQRTQQDDELRRRIASDIETALGHNLPARMGTRELSAKLAANRRLAKEVRRYVYDDPCPAQPMPQHLETEESEVGRAYESLVCKIYEDEGWHVEQNGAMMGVSDQGRDLIAHHLTTNQTLVIQCKCWASARVIHENVIYQLYGSVAAYQIDNPIRQIGTVLVSPHPVSPDAARAAGILGIELRVIPAPNSLTDFPPPPPVRKTRRRRS